jgi:hypothetical protein
MIRQSVRGLTTRSCAFLKNGRAIERKPATTLLIALAHAPLLTK